MFNLRSLQDLWHDTFAKRPVRRDERDPLMPTGPIDSDELILSEAEKIDIVAKAIVQLRVLPAEDRLSILMGVVIHVMQDVGFDKDHAKDVFNDCVDAHFSKMGL